MRCDRSAVALAGLPGSFRPLVDRHVASCLRCQVEQARYRRLLRLLAQLRAEQAALGPGVLASVLETIGAAAAQQAVDPSGPDRGRPWRASLAGGVLGGAVVLLAARGRLARRGAPASQCYR